MKYNEQDMAKLISEVETEFKDYLTKAEQVTKNEKKEVSSEAIFEYDADDISEMNKMYASMNKSEKEAHYSAIKKTLFGEESSQEMKKSEKKEEVVAKSEVEAVKKNLESSTKENEELKKNIETLTSIVSQIVKRAPARKAVTQINDIQVMKKSEEEVEDKAANDLSKLSKSEINKILTSKIRSGEITKAEDKNNINKFCYGEIQIDKIKHLL